MQFLQDIKGIESGEAILTHKFLVGWAAWIKVKEAQLMTNKRRQKAA